MEPANDLTSNATDWVLAAEGTVYLALLKIGAKPDNILRVPSGQYSGRRYDPRKGILAGKTSQYRGDRLTIPNPPAVPELDWLFLLQRIQSMPRNEQTNDFVLKEQVLIENKRERGR